MAREFRPGDVEVTTLDLVTHDGERQVSLLNQFLQLSVFESVFGHEGRPTMKMVAVVRDPVGIRPDFGLIGQERIHLEFTVPSIEGGFSQWFSVVAVRGGTNEQGQNLGQTYVLECESPEAIIDAAAPLRPGRLQGPPHEIIARILGALNPDRPVIVEPCKGIESLLVGTMRPMEVARMIRQRAVSVGSLSSSYCLFLNQRGFCFGTLEHLMEAGREAIGDKVFFIDTAPGTDVRNTLYRGVTALRVCEGPSTRRKLEQGAFKSAVKRFDMFTGKIEETVSVIGELEDRFKTLSETPVGLNTTAFVGEMTRDIPAATFLVPVDGSLPESFRDAMVGPLQLFVSRITQLIVDVQVPGDPALTAGDVVTLKLPSQTATTGPQREDRLTSGNFLATHVRHTIMNGSSRGRYSCSMRLVKGSYEDRA